MTIHQIKRRIWQVISAPFYRLKGLDEVKIHLDTIGWLYGTPAMERQVFNKGGNDVD